MPLIAPLWAWIVSLLGAVFTSVATWLIGRVAFEKAIEYALIVAFLVASAALFLSVTIGIKTAIFTARVAMPTSLGMATFFLPASIAQIMAFIVTARVSHAVYRWTVNTMAAFVPHNPRTGLGNY